MPKSGGKLHKLSGLIALSLVAATSNAAAHSRHAHHPTRHVAYRHTAYRGARVIQCVAFAKQDAGIEISGNARDWWSNAEGIYQRGARPEPGSVLSFRANGRMPLGHVAVVSGVEDSRTIVIDQSHWGSRGITRDIEVKDVSDYNDWSAVRVQLGHGRGFGSIYPTHGFIYPRPDHGIMVANNVQSPLPSLDPAPADLRQTSSRHRGAPVIEIAELPDPAPGRPLDLSLNGIATDAPDRSIR